MQQQEIISVNDFCVHHHIEMSFIHALKDEGLLEVVMVDEKLCVPLQQLPQLEKMTRLYYDMDINIEGIESITHLLKKIEEMKQHIILLNNRLRLYESDI